LLGVTISERRFALVSDWMDNGNINQFIEQDQQANRPMLVRHYSSLSRKLTNAL
jgi:hypothetical protein